MPGGLPGPWWALVVLGLSAGVVSATLGVGSGIIVVPALALVFALPQKSAQGTALAVMAPMALVGALRYWQDPAIRIDFPVVGILAVGAVVGALAGAAIAGRVPALWLKRLFAVFVLVVGIRMFLTTFTRKATPVDAGGTAAPSDTDEGGAHD
ncbi:MAG: sulfite exporter TauE/SafE family protein [Planctomycetota bacterium]